MKEVSVISVTPVKGSNDTLVRYYLVFGSDRAAYVENTLSLRGSVQVERSFEIADDLYTILMIASPLHSFCEITEMYDILLEDNRLGNDGM